MLAASSSLSPTVGWSTISAATETTEQPRWTPFSIVSTRKAPWYIKERYSFLWWNSSEIDLVNI